MPSMQSRLAARLPRGLKPLAKRVKRRLDQLRGLRTSAGRKGVVVMLHIGRCGSTVLAHMLEQHPQIHWDAKVYRKAQRLYGKKLPDFDYVNWTKQQLSSAGAGYYGFEFKVLADQYPAVLGTTLEAFLKQCKAIGVTHYVILQRRNTLLHVVSHYVSKVRGAWHFAPTDEVRAQRFALDLANITTGSSPGRSIVQYLEEVEATHQSLHEWLRAENVLTLEYESDIERDGAHTAFDKVCGFLGLSRSEAAVKNRKANPFPIAETISNFDELANALSGTRFQWMLETDSSVDPRPRVDPRGTIA